MEQVHEILNQYRAHLPLTIRQIFYRLVGRYDYPKTEAAYEKLCNYLTRARRSGMIPFEAIRDDGITVMNHAHYNGEDDFYRRIRRMGERYKQDKLANQLVDIRVFCEAEGMLPQLNRVLEPYSVSVQSCSGFDSLTAKRDVVRWSLDTELYEGKLPVLLHLGDCDPSGNSIFDSFRDDVLAFLEKDDPDLLGKVWDRDSFRRVALTTGQIAHYRLPTAPPKKDNPHGKDWEGGTCQLEALEPDDLQAIVTEEVASWFDLYQLEEDREEEITTRRNIQRALTSAGEGS